MNNYSFLRQVRTNLTRDNLLDMAGQLAAQNGLELVTTGLLAEQADLSPEQMFRFFKDRAALIEAMIDRLHTRQTEAVNIWFGRHAGRGQAQMADHVEDLVAALFKASASIPGAAQLHQALYSQPNLAPRRTAMRCLIADRFADAVALLEPTNSREKVWPRYRMAVEMALTTETMAPDIGHTEQKPGQQRLIGEAARVLRFALEAA